MVRNDTINNVILVLKESVKFTLMMILLVIISVLIFHYLFVNILGKDDPILIGLMSALMTGLTIHFIDVKITHTSEKVSIYIDNIFDRKN